MGVARRRKTAQHSNRLATLNVQPIFMLQLTTHMLVFESANTRNAG